MLKSYHDLCHIFIANGIQTQVIIQYIQCNKITQKHKLTKKTVADFKLTPSRHIPCQKKKRKNEY